jgi:hypothetical protein
MTPTENQAAGAESATELLARRAQLQEWLGRLGEIGSDIPSQVARRVRADYEQRLAAVVAELSAHSEALAADRERLDEQLLASAERHDAATDALEETRLRHLIGELSSEDWESRRPGLESEVEAAAAERAGTEREIAALEELLAQISVAAAAAWPDEPTVESGAPVDAPEEAASESVGPDAPVAVGANDFASAADEWDPELPEIEEEAAAAEPLPELQAAEAAGAAAEEVGEEAAPLDVGAYSAEAEERRAVEEDLIQITNFAAAAEALADEVDPAPADDDYAFLEELDRAIAATAPTGESAEEDTDGKTRPQPGLKCPDCGYSNDPAAWYCGVCGVDLG